MPKKSEEKKMKPAKSSKAKSVKKKAPSSSAGKKMVDMLTKGMPKKY